MELRDVPKSTTTKQLLIAEGGVKFICPNCGQGVIIRTNKERRMGIKWVCQVCGFEGP